MYHRCDDRRVFIFERRELDVSTDRVRRLKLIFLEVFEVALSVNSIHQLFLRSIVRLLADSLAFLVGVGDRG